MKLTNLTFSRNLDSRLVRKYQGFMLLYFFLFIALVLGFAVVLEAPSIEPDVVAMFFFLFACFLAGQGFFIVVALSRVESNLADVKRLNEPAGREAVSDENRADAVLQSFRRNGS